MTQFTTEAAVVAVRSKVKYSDGVFVIQRLKLVVPIFCRHVVRGRNLVIGAVLHVPCSGEVVLVCVLQVFDFRSSAPSWMT
jgi:hypothetical protein